MRRSWPLAMWRSFARAFWGFTAYRTVDTYCGLPLGEVICDAYVYSSPV